MLKLLTFWPSCYHISLLKHLPPSLLPLALHSLPLSPFLSYLDFSLPPHSTSPLVQFKGDHERNGVFLGELEHESPKGPWIHPFVGTLLYSGGSRGQGHCLTSYTKLVQELKLESRSSVHLLSAISSTLPAFLTSNIPTTPRLE